MTQPLLDPPQVADLLRCSVRTVEDHARSGTLPGVKFGEGWVFPFDALMRAINRLAEEEASRRSKPEPIRAKKVKPTRTNLSLLG